jgi:hypothetical protein
MLGFAVWLCNMSQADATGDSATCWKWDLMLFSPFLVQVDFKVVDEIELRVEKIKITIGSTILIRDDRER